jgi:hypothetical protein
MHYRRGVHKLRVLAEACQGKAPFLHEAYVFGELLDGDDPLDHVKVALVLDLPPEEVPWGSQPRGTAWLVDVLRLGKGGFAYWWRSRHEPVWNHHIRRPVRFWSADGPDEDVLRALEERRFGDLPRLDGEPDVRRELDRSLTRLRNVREHYWDRDWRREHRAENELWEAVDAYLDLLDHEPD